MDDLLSEFLTETAESLATLDLELVKLEQNPDPVILSNIFRLVHTIKGTCGFLGLPRLEAVAHAGENVLGKFRDKELSVTPGAVTLILHSIDRIKAILAHIEQHEAEPDGNDLDLIHQLDAVAEGKPIPGDHFAVAPVEVAAPQFEEIDWPVPEAVEAYHEEPAPLPVAQPSKPPATSNVPAAPAAAAQSQQTALTGQTVNGPAGGAATEPKESAVAAQSIRVNVDLLENLMTLVSELVLTRNQLLQMVRGKDDSEFATPLQRLSHITTDLQEGVMKTRMQPIGNAWAKLPRIVRDLSVEMAKKIDLQMVGAETELDRQVLD